jgi:hypothetical protein
MENLFSLIIKPLEENEFDYMISGSVAAMTYGEPRLTNDIDLVLALPLKVIPNLEKAFPDDQFYHAPTEVIVAEASRAQRGHTNIIHHQTGFRADVYFRGNDDLHAWAWSRRQRLEIEPGLMASFAPPEYVILRKLEYFAEGHSEKHLTDIRAILEQDEMSHLAGSEDIKEWSQKLGVAEHWEKIQTTLE